MRLETDTLSQAERLAAVLDHREADRVPCFLMGLERSGSFWDEFMAREGELLDSHTDDERNIVMTPCGDYTVPVFFGADVVLHGCNVHEPASTWVDMHGSSPTPRIEPLDQGFGAREPRTGFLLTYYGSINKVERLPNEKSYTWHWGPHLRTPEMLVAWFDEHGWPADLPVDPYPASIVETNARFKDVVHVIPAYGPSTFTHLQTMLGVDRIYYFARKSPDVLRRIVDSFMELQLRQVELMRPLHPVAAFTYDDLGQKDRSLLSPSLFNTFFAPARARVNDAIHDLGARSILHSCGNVTELLPDLIAAGFDGWQTLEPASGIDHLAVKKRFGDKLSFWGAIDNNVLCFGTPRDVETEVRDKLRIMAPGGGYLAGPAHDYLNTRVDNAIALRGAVIAHGAYGG